MAYRALYRKWRPMRFADVSGQEHIIKVLTGQIESGRIAHAYLFSGPRGTGKTSLAKIFARAANCTNRQGAESCGVCPVCRETAGENPIDIMEIDAASNNGVDSVRDIRDHVNLLPAVCRYKVYIIDEVHMLSKGAFNALLKTLEEPPSHVIFILATTEPHKLPPTILSRCQRFDFKRISLEDITRRLAEVARGEGYTFEEEALPMIARAAEGGMRDALSILDQCAAFGPVTRKSVAASLGGGDAALLAELAARITAYDQKGALEHLSALLNAGADTRALIKDLAELFRRMMWLAVGAAPAEDEAELARMAQSYGKNACIRALNILIQKEYEMRQNLRTDIVLETAVMALMCPEDDADADTRARIEKLEARIEKLEQQRTMPQQTAAAPVSAEPPKPPKPKKKAQPSSPAKTRAEAGEQELWQQVLEAIKAQAYFIYPHAQKVKHVRYSGDLLELTLDEEAEIAAEFLKQPATQETLIKMLEKLGSPATALNVVIEKRADSNGAQADILAMFKDYIEEI